MMPSTLSSKPAGLGPAAGDMATPAAAARVENARLRTTIAGPPRSARAQGYLSVALPPLLECPLDGPQASPSAQRARRFCRAAGAERAPLPAAAGFRVGRQRAHLRIALAA